MRSLFSRSLKPSAGGRALPLYDLWDKVAGFAAEIRASSFMVEMLRRHNEQGRGGMMGMLDCSTLYGLVRWQRPAVVVEVGGYLGMSSSFILKALADAGRPEAKVYSVEFDPECPHGILVPEELRAGFVPLRARVEDLLKQNQLPPEIDLYLHDSSHRYAHMLWEFRAFWKKLRSGGMMISHDVNFNAAFAEFVARTYAHDRSGLRDEERTRHAEWGRWGYLGFLVKQ